MTRCWRPRHLAVITLLILTAGCGGGDNAGEWDLPNDIASFRVHSRVDSRAAALLTTECAVSSANEIDTRPPPEWRAFRSSHPYHIQSVALGDPSADGSRLLVISEPPPWVCLSTLKELAPELSNLRVQEWRVGHDGWVRDVTIRLPALDSLQLGLLLQDVHRTLFGTTYKAETLPLRSAAGSSLAPLDLRITAVDLNRWLILDAERFSSNGAGSGQSVHELLAGDAYGIHFSTTPGLVVWVLPRSENIARFRIDARHWALDSDIVLGGIGDSRNVAIVARERIVSPEILPPLRVETIMQLAAAGNEHLAQSYERTFVLAGPTTEGKDWAPIYLSPELVDSEYGSLLNITDQMLKSWSQHGEVEYVNFRYPRPRHFPFTRALSDELGSEIVTFNWNTKGAGYVIEDSGLAVYALNRTGSLPVSYFAGEEGQTNDATLTAELKGYDYFATLNDPNLARVVQYAALYQLFRAFDVQAQVQAPATPSPAAAALRPRVLEALEQFAGVDPTLFTSVDDPGVQRRLSEAQDTLSTLIKRLGRAPLERISDRLLDKRYDPAARIRDAELTNRLGSSGGIESASDEDRTTLTEIRLAGEMSNLLYLWFDDVDRSQAMREFRRAAAAPSRPWIHTASTVRSRNTRSTSSVGGHNLDAAVTHFRADPTLARGQVQFVDEGGARVIVASVDDISRMSEDLRSVARTTDEAALRAHLSALARRADVPPRPRAEVLPAPVRGVSRGLVERRNVVSVGHEHIGRELTAAEQSASALLQAHDRAYIAVTKRSGGGYEIVLGSQGEIVSAPNLVSALDVIATQSYTAGPTSVRQYQLLGFDDLSATAFNKNVELALRRRGHADPDRIASVVRRTGVDESVALEAATRRLDLRGAEVRLVQETQMEIGGVVHRAYQIEVEVAVAATRKPVLLRIWILFKDGMVRPVTDAVRVRVARILEALGRDVPPDLAATVIQNELKNSFGSIETVRVDLEDILFAYAPSTKTHGHSPDHTSG